MGRPKTKPQTEENFSRTIEITTGNVLQVNTELMSKIKSGYRYLHKKSDGKYLILNRHVMSDFVLTLDDKQLVRNQSITLLVQKFNDNMDKPPRSDSSYYKTANVSY